MIDNEYEFRRGYNYGFSDGNAEGKAWEQRRIIKLLEENLISAKLGVIPVGNSNWWQKGMEYAIELIKGESQKDNETVSLLTPISHDEIEWLDEPIPVPDPRDGETNG